MYRYRYRYRYRYKVFECDCRYWVRSAVDTLGPVPVAATNISRTVFNPANVTQGGR